MSRRTLIACLFLIVLVAIGWNWWQSDRRQIARQLDHLQELVAKDGPESALEGLAEARAITGLFASAFEIRARQLDFATRDRQELIRFIHQYRSGSESIHMRVSTGTLNVVPEHRRATLDATLEFPSGGPLGGADEAYHVQVNWLEENGVWRIDYVDLLEIIDR